MIKEPLKRFLSPFIVLSFILPQLVFATGIDGEMHDIGHTAITGVNTAQQSMGTATGVKEYVIEILEQVGATIAGQLLNKLTESTVNWINSGFEENPQFVENPTSFFKNIADVEVKAVVDQIGYDSKNFPFGKGVAVSLIKEYVNGQGDLKDKATFTLDKTLGSNWHNFSTDFSVGGWKGLDEIVNNPANTPMGAYQLAKSALNKKIDKQTDKIDKELTRGQGFLDQKVCVKKKPDKNIGKAEQQATVPTVNTGSTLNGINSSSSSSSSSSGPTVSGTPTINAPLFNPSTPLPSGPTQSQPSIWSSITNVDEKDCDQYKSLSPGSFVEAELNSAMKTKKENIALSSVMGNLSSSLGAITNALVNTMVSKGLGALSSKNKKAPSQTEDNWNYNGVTLVPGKTVNPDGTVSYAQGFNYDEHRIIDLEELLITGAPDKTEIIYDVVTGDPQVKVLTRKKTVLDRTKEEKTYYLKIAELVDGNTDKGIESLAEKLRKLDYCIPGPDYDWEKRVDATFARPINFLYRKANAKNEKKAEKANRILDELEGKQDEVKRYIKVNYTENNIPSFPELSDKIQQTRRYSVKAKEYYEKYITKTTTVAQLENIKRQYLQIKQNPATAPVEIGELLQRYAALETDVSNDFSYGEARNDYDRIKLSYDDLVDGLDTCRREKGNNPRTFTVEGQARSAFDDSNPQTEEGNLPSEISTMTLIDIEPNTVSTKLKTDFGVSAAKTLELGPMSEDDIKFMYNIINAYGSNTQIQGLLGPALSGDALFDTTKLYVENMTDYGTVALTVTNETRFYCWDQLKRVNTSNYWRNKDVNITCDKFYHTQTNDYQIDKTY